MRRTQEHEEQREPAEGRDTAKRNIACASKCQRGSVAGGKRKSGVMTEASARCGQDPDDGRHWTVKHLLKIRLSKQRTWRWGKWKEKLFPGSFPRRQDTVVVHTNVDTKKEIGRSETHLQLKLSELSVEKKLKYL